MGLSFSVLASGSTGNAAVIRSKDVMLMVDAGLSAKKLEQLLSEREVSGEHLDGILVTHEHSDHIKGLGAIARKYKLSVYANEKTWEAMNKHVGQLEDEQKKVIEIGQTLQFGELTVESYPLSHDAAEPMGFCFRQGDRKVSIATDLGYVSAKVREKILDSDAIVLESNHDVEMLRVGRYPWNIKRRILSDVGHLSNEAAGEALVQLLSENTRRVYLAHLSQDHNMMDLAKLTVNTMCKERGIHLENRRVKLMDTYYDRPTLWDDLDY
ncbi:MBL fold metallo-hydrolase [Marinicrinis lubricantis]|uniref:MBL fold metallo-hydrolase n=1 Tax=Marinicrinis lubricantis TaxID=2086470 RepID=A0ABW1IQR3_9BACL